MTFIVVSIDQILACGVSEATVSRRVRDGIWERVHRGVYRISAAPLTWRGRLLAACYAVGPGAVASHRAAATLRQLRGFDRRTVEVTVVRGNARTAKGAIVHRTNLLSPVDIEVVDAIPVTTVARTLIDLAGSAPRLEVEAALDDALFRGLVGRLRLRRRLDALSAKGRPGVAILRELLDEREGVVSFPQSDFETLLFRALRDSRLPRPETQHPVRRNGRVVATVDFAYPDASVAIEADGRRFHSSRIDFERDRERTNDLAALGWRVIRVTWTALKLRPAEVVAAITEVLSAGRSNKIAPDDPRGATSSNATAGSSLRIPNPRVDIVPR